jgi:hypothetical protein
VSGTSRHDVAVVGGGPAGIAAALSAARGGARTILIERDDRLGGNASQALVHTICGLFLPDRDTAVPAHPGFPTRLATALARAGGAGEPEAAGRVFYLPIRPPVLAELIERLCASAEHLTVRKRATLVAARLAEEVGEPSQLRMRSQHGDTAIEASVVIDASGEAITAHLGGAETVMASAEILQRPSFIFRLTGVAREDLAGFSRLQLTAAVAHAARRGTLPPDCESVVLRSDGAPGSFYATLTLPPLDERPLAPLDPDYLEALRARAQERAGAVVSFLRRAQPGFAHARVADWPARVGVRETRRLVGRVVVTHQDLLSGLRRVDEVALSTWPIELWEDHRRPHFVYPEAPSSVPLGALVSRTHPMLGVAGRCLSSTHEALGALRVIGTALATGEAIGVAAALAADTTTALAAIPPARVVSRVLAAANEDLA